MFVRSLLVHTVQPSKATRTSSAYKNNNMTSQKRSRAAKVTMEQTNALVDFLSQPEHKILLTLKPHPSRADELNKLWAKAQSSLNNLRGPKKSGEDWRRFFVELKSRTKKKARVLRLEQTKTGGGPKSTKPLTDLEEKLMSLIGWVSVTGCEELPKEVDPDDEYLNYDEAHAVDEFDNPFSPSVPPANLVDIAAAPEADVLSEKNSVSPTFARPTRKRIYNTSSNAKSKRVKKNTYCSGISLLKNSAQMYAESSEKLSGAMTHIGDAIMHVGNAIQMLATALSEHATMAGEEIQLVADQD